MKSIKNILVTTDFSKDSDYAVEEAAFLAKKFHAALYILNTVDTIEDCTADYCIPYEVINGEKERLISIAREKLTRKAAELENRFRIKACAEVRYGNPFNEIIKAEEEKNIDLVVIAPHRRKSILGRLFFHLSGKVAKNSRCDTLLVRG